MSVTLRTAVASGGRPLDHRERRAKAAREDVRLDPVRPARCRSYAASGKVIDLEAQSSAGPQRPIAGLEERPEILRPDRLEHLDRDDCVVRGVDVAVVAQLNVDEVIEARFAERAVRTRAARARS